MRDMITLQVLKLDAVENVWLMDDQIGLQLLFRGVTAAGVTQSVCLLPPIARSQLGVRGDSSRVTLKVEPQLFARFLFYWNHPSDAAWIAFKLGGLALEIAVVQFAFC